MRPSTYLERFDERWHGASIRRDSWHLHRALFHRYKIVLGPGEFSGILREIQSGRALLLEERSNGYALFWVRIPGQFERAFIVARGRRRLITALPPTRRLKRLRLQKEQEQESRSTPHAQAGD
ncbi:MAG: hypothetical protein K5872_13395 [Rhizobiaceae bacterium]|nr:hypothetical protein [Rhizobiaceae bacterium]MCV0407215.1 hypothetical protein [Rhizobiaceae bacterium]